jgi:AraC family transcriptional regulator, regulatory protein of adaptative response / DNA-3-methyladenine glycosylase II
MTPMRIRRLNDSGSPGLGGAEIDLAYKSPYDWPAIIGFYRSHSIPGIEQVTENSFARPFRIENTVGFVHIRPAESNARLTVRIVPGDPKIVSGVVNRIRKMFDLDCDPMEIANSFGRVPLPAGLCCRYPGLRLPRGWDAFETAVCSILGQLVSAEQRANLIGQLVSNYGTEIVNPVTATPTRLFPGAEILASADLSAVKTTTARRAAIREFSRRVLSRAISLADSQDLSAFRQALLETRGLGPWSAEYISLRAIGDTDAFPKTDLILKRVLELHPDLDLELIKPWKSYAAMYLWKKFAQRLSKRKKEKPT